MDYVSLLLEELGENKDLISRLFNRTNGKSVFYFTGEKYYGFVDFGAGMENGGRDISNKALVFMVVCINDTWKVPIGYFSSKI